MTDEAKRLRSADWFGRHDKSGFRHRSWMKNQGFAYDSFDGRPVIGICNTWSELTPCNAHLRGVAEAVKRGVWQAGGFPLEFPVMSLGETLMRPTTMLFRNLMSMDVEESIRANPLDGVVLLSGCDKTTPAVIMGAASVDLPTLVITGGPMLSGKYRGEDIGSGTDFRRLYAEVRAGQLSFAEFEAAEGHFARSPGHCMVMGTASTMASMTEALGLSLSGVSAIPAVDSRRIMTSQLAGRRIVEMVKEGARLSRIVTRQSFENAIRVNAALGGSTNAILHLIAIARRVGVPLAIDDFDALARDVPLLANLKPSGRYLMEDYFYAGGLPAVMRELGDLLHGEAMTVNGRTLAENVADAECFNRDVIRTRAEALGVGVGTAVLRGSLAPRGAVIKQSAASPELMRTRGRAVVFESIEDLNARLDRPDLEVDERSVLVLKNCGPRGYPGMAEVGDMPVPKKLLERGVRDIVRISDARMSGTAFGTVVLHVAPEAAAGGPLALVETGDEILLDVPARRLDLCVGEATLARRQARWQPPERAHARGYARLYVDHVLQADEGADLDFLVGGSGDRVLRESH